MGLSQPHRGVDVERVEAWHVAQRRLGDLGGAGMRHAVGAPNDEALEGIARIERRALEAADAGPADGLGRGDDADVAAALLRHRAAGAVGAVAGGSRRRLAVGPHYRAPPARLAQHHIDLLRTLELGTAAGKQVIGVVGLDPGPQKLDRDRDPDRLGIEAFELERMEPARENVVAEPRSQHRARLLPARFARPVSGGTLDRTRVTAGRNCTFRLLNRLH